MNRERAALKLIATYKRKYGIAPSGAEIGKHLGVSRSTAYNLLKRMEEEGLIERPLPHHRGTVQWVGHRSIRLTSAAMKAIEETM